MLRQQPKFGACDKEEPPKEEVFLSHLQNHSLSLVCLKSGDIPNWFSSGSILRKPKRDTHDLSSPPLAFCAREVDDFEACNNGGADEFVEPWR